MLTVEVEVLGERLTVGNQGVQTLNLVVTFNTGQVLMRSVGELE